MAEVQRLFDLTQMVREELKRRGTEARRCLIPLMDYPDLFVRKAAASECYRFATEKAHATLVELSECGHSEVRLEAGMTLVPLERGFWVPE